jgi:hypothetical protein
MPVSHARATAMTSTDEHAAGQVPGLLDVRAQVPDPAEAARPPVPAGVRARGRGGVRAGRGDERPGDRRPGRRPAAGGPAEAGRDAPPAAMRNLTETTRRTDQIQSDILRRGTKFNETSCPDRPHPVRHREAGSAVFSVNLVPHLPIGPDSLRLGPDSARQDNGTCSTPYGGRELPPTLHNAHYRRSNRQAMPHPTPRPWIRHRSQHRQNRGPVPVQTIRGSEQVAEHRVNRR